MWKTLGEVLPDTIGPSAVIISVGINVALGGNVELVKLLTAGSYISIMSSSMQAVSESRQQWRDLCAECANIDEMFELPDAEPLTHTSDGSIQLKNASFGWPAKPPAAYSVKAKDTVCQPLEASAAELTLAEGELVESVDGQKNSDSVRVKTKDGKANGWVKKSALKELPEKPLAEWPDPSPGIESVDLYISQGELVLISGPVAGGKSTLLQSLVGNTEQLGGELAVPPSVAFQPQSPILFDQTIRANILFGIAEEDANEDYIQQSLEASTLSLDMDDPESTLHAKRELTSAGQNGSELSGGQQARVALARCIYASLAGSECVILDDPIKALDPHTAAAVWDNIKPLLAGKTRIMVVNSQMLQRFASDKAVNRLIIVENTGDKTAGRITYNGKPADMPISLQDRLGDGYTMIPTGSDAVAEMPAKLAIEVPTPAKKPAAAASGGDDSPGAQHDNLMKAKKEVLQKKQKEETKKEEKKKKKDDEKGSIPASVMAYCKRMGVWILISAGGNVLNQVAMLVLYGWNERWAADAFGWGFGRNYAVAWLLTIAAQATRFFQVSDVPPFLLHFHCSLLCLTPR